MFDSATMFKDNTPPPKSSRRRTSTPGRRGTSPPIQDHIALESSQGGSIQNAPSQVAAAAARRTRAFGSNSTNARRKAWRFPSINQCLWTALLLSLLASGSPGFLASFIQTSGALANLTADVGGAVGTVAGASANITEAVSTMVTSAIKTSNSLVVEAWKVALG